MVPVSTTYDYALVVLSIAIAIAASYSAFSFGERVAACNGDRWSWWLAIGAFAMGVGIWSMHCTGMLAVRLPVPVLYHVPTVLLSLVLAVFASAVALALVSPERLETPLLLMGGLPMGGGFGAMHYSCTAAHRCTPILIYNGLLVALYLTVSDDYSNVALCT